MRRISFLVPAVLALVLGGCAGQAITVNDYSPSYEWDDVRYAQDGRDTRVVIRGNPFGLQQPIFEKAVLDAMRGQQMWLKTNFTASPANAHKDFKVVMLFNGPDDVLGEDLCSVPGKYSSVSGSTGFRVQAAWCYGDDPETQVVGSAGANSVNSPAFAALIGQTTRALFPFTPDDDDGQDNDLVD